MMWHAVGKSVRMWNCISPIVQLDQLVLVVRLDQTVNQQLTGVKVVLAGMVIWTTNKNPASGGYNSWNKVIIKYFEDLKSNLAITSNKSHNLLKYFPLKLC